MGYRWSASLRDRSPRHIPWTHWTCADPCTHTCKCPDQTTRPLSHDYDGVWGGKGGQRCRCDVRLASLANTGLQLESSRIKQSLVASHQVPWLYSQDHTVITPRPRTSLAVTSTSHRFPGSTYQHSELGSFDAPARSRGIHT